VRVRQKIIFFSRVDIICNFSQLLNNFLVGLFGYFHIVRSVRKAYQLTVGTDIGSVEVAEVEEFLQCFSEGIFIYDAVACDRTVLLVLRKQ
jgi:hypothetical protein